MKKITKRFIIIFTTISIIFMMFIGSIIYFILLFIKENPNSLSSLDVWEDNIIWIENISLSLKNKQNLWLYNINNNEKTLIFQTLKGFDNSKICNGKIIWQENLNKGTISPDLDRSTITIYDIETKKKESYEFSSFISDYEIYADYLLVTQFIRDRGGDCLVLYNLSTFDQKIISSLPEYRSYIDYFTLNDKYIIWWDTADNSYLRIYEISSENIVSIRIVDRALLDHSWDKHDQYHNLIQPSIFHDAIVYVGCSIPDSDHDDIFIFNISANKTNQITRDQFHEISSLIYGNTIVWHTLEENIIYYSSINTIWPTEFYWTHNNIDYIEFYNNIIVWSEYRNRHDYIKFGDINTKEITIITI